MIASHTLFSSTLVLNRRQLARQGLNVAILSRSEEKLNSVASVIRKLMRELVTIFSVHCRIFR